MFEELRTLSESSFLDDSFLEDYAKTPSVFSSLNPRLRSLIANIFEVTFVEPCGKNEVRKVQKYVIVKDGRLWWFEDYYLAEEFLDGEKAVDSEENYIEVQGVTINHGILYGSGFEKLLEKEEDLDHHICISICNTSTLDIMMKDEDDLIWLVQSITDELRRIIRNTGRIKPSLSSHV